MLTKRLNLINQPIKCVHRKAFKYPLFIQPLQFARGTNKPLSPLQRWQKQKFHSHQILPNEWRTSTPTRGKPLEEWQQLSIEIPLRKHTWSGNHIPFWNHPLHQSLSQQTRQTTAGKIKSLHHAHRTFRVVGYTGKMAFVSGLVEAFLGDAKGREFGGVN